jgi:hypothetical protein
MEQKSIYYRYFVYSAEEEDLRKRVHGENVSFGTVIVNGVAKRYTSIVTDPANTKSDALIVCKGDIRKIKYTPPTR